MNRSSRPQGLVFQHQPTSSVSSSESSSEPASRCTVAADNLPPLSNGSSASTTTTCTAHPLTNVAPAPAYIAPSAATRLVTSDHRGLFRSLRDDGVIGPATPTMCVSANSLGLVNRFLDFLLYSFLANARSTSIAALRPAITEVLRARLAKEAVAGADQELRSYLGGDDQDVDPALLGQPHAGPNNDTPTTTGNEWNLDQTWRKCRVQCMVYSSLGDLEEDDEAFYSENGLEGAVGLEQYECQSSNPGVVSPAVAIWLTSILEFIGEQTLLVAGHATIARYSAQRIVTAACAPPPPSSASAETAFPSRPMVEELDTEKVALNPSLGRMWRQWRKKTRGGRPGSFSVPTRDSVLHRRQASLKQALAADEAAKPNNDAVIRVEDVDSANPIVTITATTTTTTNPNSNRSTSLPEGTLTPIVETATPGLLDTSPKRFGPRDREDVSLVFPILGPDL